jgi:hypothetical protein
MVVLGSRSRASSFLDAKRLLRFGFVENGLEVPPEPKATPRRPGRARRSAATAKPTTLQ